MAKLGRPAESPATRGGCQSRAARLHALIMGLICLDDTAQAMEGVEKADIRSCLTSMAVRRQINRDGSGLCRREDLAHLLSDVMRRYCRGSSVGYGWSVV